LCPASQASPTAMRPSACLRRRILVVTTLGYIGCFAAWTIFAIIGVEIQRQYSLSDTGFGLLLGIPFQSGSLIRVALGVWVDRHGGRRLFLGVMIIAAVATWFAADATTFPTILVAGLGTGVAGAAPLSDCPTSRDGIRKSATARRWVQIGASESVANLTFPKSFLT
jgi:sugar phosphate permease